MTDVLLGLVLILGVAIVACGLHQIYEPATYLWIGWCLMFVTWRVIRTRRSP